MVECKLTEELLYRYNDDIIFLKYKCSVKYARRYINIYNYQKCQNERFEHFSRLNKSLPLENENENNLPKIQILSSSSPLENFLSTLFSSSCNKKGEVSSSVRFINVFFYLKISIVFFFFLYDFIVPYHVL